MSNIKELIRREIERLKSKYRHNGLWTSSLQSDLAMAKIESMNELLAFLDTLPDEPEQPTRGYDEAYLNEKIAKASKSWEWVDVDKFMDEVRGREKTVTDCHDLTDAAKKYAEEQAFWWIRENPYTSQEYAFKAGAECMKTKMMEGAVEGVVYRYESYQKIATAIIVDVPKESLDNKVRIIILPKED